MQREGKKRKRDKVSNESKETGMIEIKKNNREEGSGLEDMVDSRERIQEQQQKLRIGERRPKEERGE